MGALKLGPNARSISINNRTVPYRNIKKHGRKKNRPEKKEGDTIQPALDSHLPGPA